MPKVIYVTGAPAAGKSSTLRMLADNFVGLLVWEYGNRLTDYVIAKSAAVNNQDELRSLSAKVVTPEDVANVDRALLAFVKENRGQSHVLIDSHPVTKEAYGYRITPFSVEQITELAPDEIWLLYASPGETQRRIAANHGGRSMVNEEEARLHTALQASVAATYGITIGKPVYLFDTTLAQQELVARLAERLS